MTNLFMPKKRNGVLKRTSPYQGVGGGSGRKIIKSDTSTEQGLLSISQDINTANISSEQSSLLTHDHHHHNLSDASLSEDDTIPLIGHRQPVLVREEQEAKKEDLREFLTNLPPASSLKEQALRVTRGNIDSNAPIDVFRKCVKAYAASLPLHLLDQVLQGQHPQQSASILESIEAASRYRADLVRPLLEEQWRALCLGEFLGKDQLLLKEGQNTSWKHLYQERRDSEENRVRRIGNSLRETYESHGKKIHHTKLIQPLPPTTSRRSKQQLPSSGKAGGGSLLMQKARAEAMQVPKRTTTTKNHQQQQQPTMPPGGRMKGPKFPTTTAFFR